MAAPKITPPPAETPAAIDAILGGQSSARQHPLRPGYRELAEKVPADAEFGLRAAYIFALAFSGTALADIDPTKVPSRGAVRMLQLAQSGDLGYQKVLDNSQKFLSDKGSADAQAQMEADQRRQGQYLDRFYADLETELQSLGGDQNATADK